jgi:hypothetical protein
VTVEQSGHSYGKEDPGPVEAHDCHSKVLFLALGFDGDSAQTITVPELRIMESAIVVG